MDLSPSRIEQITNAWGLKIRAVEKPESGTNNVVLFLNSSFVLRIYRNIDATRVAAMHRLLAALRETGLAYEVPTPVPTAAAETHVSTPDGPAALYQLIPGRRARNPDLAYIETVGVAVADLMSALAQLPPELAPTDWRGPLSTVHPAVPDVSDLIHELRRIAPSTPGLDILDAMWSSVDAAYLAMDLPCQVCHLDMAPSNVLIDDGRAVAILDFEVAGFDIRVNDFVAGLVQSTDTQQEADAFVRGFRSRIDLTPDEWAAVPTLRKLREIATVVWRAGRWREGKDSLDQVLERLASVTPLPGAGD